MTLGWLAQEASLELQQRRPAAALASAVEGHCRAGRCRALPGEARLHAHGGSCTTDTLMTQQRRCLGKPVSTLMEGAAPQIHS